MVALCHGYFCKPFIYNSLNRYSAGILPPISRHNPAFARIIEFWTRGSSRTLWPDQKVRECEQKKVLTAIRRNVEDRVRKFFRPRFWDERIIIAGCCSRFGMHFGRHSPALKIRKIQHRLFEGRDGFRPGPRPDVERGAGALQRAGEIAMEPTTDLGTAPFGCPPLQVHPRYSQPAELHIRSGRCPHHPTATVW